MLQAVNGESKVRGPEMESLLEKKIFELEVTSTAGKGTSQKPRTGRCLLGSA